jgi:tetratricopeptide (TPR) repeat protein
MQRKHLLFAIALLAILFSILLLTVPGSHALANNTIFIETPTATPDANKILNQANAVATQAALALSQADHASSEAQSTLSIFNTLLGFLVFIIALVGAALGLIGVSTIGDIRKQLLKGVERVDNLEVEAAEKKVEIGRTQTALENTQKALVYLGLGDQLYRQDRKQEAVAIYRKVGSLLPKDSEINNSLGRIYSSSGYYEDAINSFTKALDTNSNFSEAEMELGLAYRRRGEAQKGPGAEALRNADYDQATAHLKRAIDMRPNYEDALAGLGAVYRRMGDIERDASHDAKAREYYEQARKYYEQAQIADPTSSYALGNVASLSWYMGGKDAASNYFILAEAAAKVRIMNMGRSPEIYWDYYDLGLAQLVLAEINKNKAMKDEAIQTYTTAIRLTPGAVQINSVLNNLYLLQKSQEHIDGLDSVITMLEKAKSK